MTSPESLRGAGPAGHGAAARERARRPRADRIEIDFSWSDRDDFGWSEPSSRQRSRRARPDEERFARGAPENLPGSPVPQDLPGLPHDATGGFRSPRPVAAPEPRTAASSAPPMGAASAVSMDPAAMLSGSMAEVLGAGAELPPRRTVVIRGQGTRGYAPSRGGYEARLRPHERSGFKPDRVALWAVLLGLALLLGAVTSSHAATLPAGGLPAATAHHLLLHHALIHLAP